MTDAMDAFKTRARANEGKRLTLYTPDGKPTEHWLQVRHVWSDAFQEAEAVETARISEALLAAEGDEVLIAEAKRQGKIRLWAALVAAWSFDTPCTPEAVADFLSEAPQIGRALDKFASGSRRFFGNGSTSSTAGSSQSEP